MRVEKRIRTKGQDRVSKINWWQLKVKKKKLLVCGGGFVIVVHGDGDCVVVVVFRGRLRWNGK